MVLALTIIHVVISLALVVVVLLQHGKQQGLSGAIAGGAETFFGKNKGRTVDAMLKKFTAVVAILFIASSVTLAAVSINEYKATTAPTETTDTGEAGENSMNVTMDENGNLVDADGNIVMTAEQMAEQQGAEGTEAGTPEEGTPADGTDAGTPEGGTEDGTADQAPADNGAADTTPADSMPAE